MEFSWDLLESTMERVSNVLGNTISDINIEQEMLNHDHEMPMDGINEHFLHPRSPYSDYNSDGSSYGYNEQIWESFEADENIAADIFPQSRERSNTWPRQMGAGLNLNDPQRNKYLPFVKEEGETFENSELVNKEFINIFVELVSNSLLSLPKKNSRRNPWGNYSYSDLIVQAIATSLEQRLTLNEIYDWMISAIPYFSERQDNASSAGWKNSIRHNLSLHQKFLQIPNEDAGKSSWWMINPDLKKTSKPRRRATYGESVDKLKHKAEAARNKERLFRASSTNRLSTLSLSPATEAFRHSSNSSASSCDDNSRSPFRPRSFSNASSNSTTSPQHLPEMMIPNFSQLVETDLDKIRLDDLTLGFQPAVPDSGEIRRGYLQPREKVIEDSSFMHQNRLMNNVTILEPRSNEAVGKYVIKLENSNETFGSFMDNSLFGSFEGPEMIEKHDEERKKMIKNELNNLIKKKIEIACNDSTFSSDNKKNLESACGMQIKLLQDELNKLDGVKTEEVNSPFYFDNAYSI